LIPHDASSREIDGLVRERLKTERALYSLDLQSLQELRPELIITQALCDVCAVAESEVSAAAHSLPSPPKVVNLEPTCLEEVYDCLLAVGKAAGVADRAQEAIGKLRNRAEIVQNLSRKIADHPRVVLLEWIDPPFCSGHWSPELVGMAGGLEVIGRKGHPSRTTTWPEIVESDPDVMIIA
jgi:iron complex transport system substrate-binding protein